MRKEKNKLSMVLLAAAILAAVILRFGTDELLASRYLHDRTSASDPARQGDDPDRASGENISEGRLRQTVMSLVTSAENSSLDYTRQYGYIEDIGDGRGYTGGIIGFTTGTADLLDVVEVYVALKPDNNGLKKYIPALQSAIGSDTHKGLGQAFVNAWKAAAQDREMIEAQDTILDEMYMKPSVEMAVKDGLSPLGQYIYYDAMVVHGPGEDGLSFGGIRKEAMKNEKTPSQGGDEAEYLRAFLTARTSVMLTEEAHSDLSRLQAQSKFIDEGKYNLELPLKWNMYGDDFELTEAKLKAIAK
ncbi:chitosanase [Butyrivibrio sp. MC2013]|uniref:chitosanase n=1 Tax=Butyrivibrio sp. MC2013 TaxID=1280686 RepID=UPI000420E807|nr:chitosanase [Butyrivibrio sp. MC2013]